MGLFGTTKPEAKYKEHFIKILKGATPPKSSPLQIEIVNDQYFPVNVKREYTSSQQRRRNITKSTPRKRRSTNDARRRLKRFFP